MSTDLILLGTGGGPTPKRNRAAPAQAVVVDGDIYVIDCGNGVARQMARAGLLFDDLRAVLVTHHHSDHNADLGTLLQLAWGANLATPVDVLGPSPILRMLASFLDYAETDIRTRTHDEGRPALRPLIRPQEVTGDGVIHEDSRVRIIATRVDHPPIEAYAYRIETADRSIVISGDTAPCQSLITLAQGADILVHEAIHLPSIELATSRTNGSQLRQHLVNSHTSVADVGRIAAQAHVRTLVLSHLVPADAATPDEVWAKEAARGFDGDIIVGQDLMVL